MHTSIIHYIIHIPTMVRQWEEAQALKQKSVMTKKQAREENVAARPSGMLGSGLW